MSATRSDVLVLFGVTGDLAHKMIFPALYALAKQGPSKSQSSASLFRIGMWRDWQTSNRQHKASGRD